MRKIDIPLTCPSCDGRMYSITYDAPLRFLQERSWQVCKECNFQQSTDDFKRRLLTV